MPATMQTRDVLTDTKWEEGHSLTGKSPEGISTEFESPYDPAWDECLDTLLDLLNNSDRLKENDPCRDAILLTGEMLVRFRKAQPHFPPTLLTREPCGGLIVDWEFRDAGGNEYLQVLTVYNDGRAEFTFFENGKVIEMLESGILYEE